MGFSADRISYSLYFDVKKVLGGIMTPEVFSMADIVTAIGNLVTGSVTWLSSMASSVASTPLLLFFVISGFVGIGVGLLMRFVRR